MFIRSRIYPGWREDRRKAILLIALYLVARVGILVFFPDTVYSTYEERCEYAVTRHIASGLHMPVFHYSITADETFLGRMFFSCLLLPAYLIFPGLFLPKLIAVAAGLLLLLLWYRFLEKYFSSDVAFIFGLFYVFCPTLMLSSQFAFTWKSHYFQNVFFEILLINLFYKILYESKAKKINYVFLGFVCAAWCSLDAMGFIAVFVLLTFWFLIERKFFVTENFVVFLMGAFLATIPWLYFHLPRVLKGVSNLDGIQTHPFSSIEKISTLFIQRFPQIFYYYGSPPLTRFVYYFVFIVAFTFLVRRNRFILMGLCRQVLNVSKTSIHIPGIPKETFFLFYVIIFLVFLFFTHEPPYIRYFSAFLPFVFVIIAVPFADFTMKRKYWRVIFVILLTLFSSFDITKRMPYYSINRTVGYDAYDYQALTGELLNKHEYYLQGSDKLKEFIRREGDGAAIISGYLKEHDLFFYFKNILTTNVHDPKDMPVFRKLLKEYAFATIDNTVSDNPGVVVDALIKVFLKENEVSGYVADFSRFTVIKSIYDVSGSSAFKVLNEVLPDFEMTFDRMNMKDIVDNVKSINLSRGQKEALYECLGVLTEHLKMNISALSLLEEIPDDFKRNFFEGFGYALCQNYLRNDQASESSLSYVGNWGEKMLDDVRIAIDGYVNLRPEYRAHMFIGLFSWVYTHRDFRYTTFPGFYTPYFDLLAVYQHINTKLPIIYRPYIYYGLGKGLGLKTFTFKEWPHERALFYLKKIKKEYRLYAVQGFFEGFRLK